MFTLYNVNDIYEHKCERYEVLDRNRAKTH
jgi:hypothetical protein